MKYFYVGIFLILTIGLAILIVFTKPKNLAKNFVNTSPTKPIFTHKMFDSEKIEYITPLGELNGGYNEFQTLNGVMIDIVPEAIKNNSGIEVYAPTDMNLVAYAHYIADGEPGPDWALDFRINDNVSMTIHHLNNAGQKIVGVVGNNPKKNNSRTNSLKNPINFKAGEIIGTTKGTSLANNWNIYLYDTSVKNQFVNQKRYEENYLGQRFVNSACPFGYYADPAIKEAFYALMGASAAGQSKDCGNPSKDKKGTLSGLWHLEQAGIESGYEGDYANPLSVYMRSDKRIIIYELGRKRHIIEEKNSTYKNPEQISGSHCYNLTDNMKPNNYQGYAYFRIDSDSEMSVSYNAFGSCPSEFPTEKSKKYFR